MELYPHSPYTPSWRGQLHYVYARTVHICGIFCREMLPALFLRSKYLISSTYLSCQFVTPSVRLSVCMHFYL